MAFEIRLYKCNKDDNQVSKTFEVFTYQQYTCSYFFATGDLRTPTEILSPTIVVDGGGFKLKTAYGEPSEVDYTGALQFIFQTANYAYIAIFNRYYFITNCRVINDRLLEIQLKVDVLKTYDSEIRSCSGFIERNENSYSDMLEDNLRPMEGKKEREIVELPTTSDCVSFHAPKAQASDPSANVKYICVTATVGAGALTAMALYLLEQYPSTFADLQAAREYIIGLNYQARHSGNIINGSLNEKFYTTLMGGNSLFRITYIMKFEDFQILQSAVLGNDSLKSFIVGAVAMPFSDPNGFCLEGLAIPVVVGTTDIKDAQSNQLYCTFSRGGTFSDYILHKSGVFPFTPVNFYDVEPYTRCDLFIPFCGSVPFPISALKVGQNVSFNLYYSADLATGECTAYVRVQAERVSLFTVSGQMGVRISLDATNARELENQIRSTAISSALGYLSSIINIGMGAVTGNPLPMVAGVTGIAKTTGSLVSSTLGMVERGNVSYTLSGSAFYDCLSAVLVKTKTAPLETGTTAIGVYRHLYGKPCRKFATLSGYTGFTIVPQIHLEGFNATKTEKEEITALLRSGVIL